MGHKTEVIDVEIVDVQHLSDGEIAVKLRCCGDESTDSVQRSCGSDCI
jgi:hypothetical protein